jgi:hypothetical protein
MSLHSTDASSIADDTIFVHTPLAGATHYLSGIEDTMVVAPPNLLTISDSALELDRSGSELSELSESEER